MRKKLLFIGFLVFSLIARPGLLIAQADHSAYLFARETMDSLTNDDRIGSFVDGLIQKIESDIGAMARERERDDDLDSASNESQVFICGRRGYIFGEHQH